MLMELIDEQGFFTGYTNSNLDDLATYSGTWRYVADFCSVIAQLEQFSHSLKKSQYM